MTEVNLKNGRVDDDDGRDAIIKNSRSVDPSHRVKSDIENMLSRPHNVKRNERRKKNADGGRRRRPQLRKGGTINHGIRNEQKTQFFGVLEVSFSVRRQRMKGEDPGLVRLGSREQRYSKGAA